METCAKQLSYDSWTFIPRLERVKDALTILVGNNACLHTPSTPIIAAEGSVQVTSGPEVINIDIEMVSSPPPCPGYPLTISEDIPGIHAYPILLHSRKTLPWTVMISDESVVLVSKSCQKSATTRTIGAYPTPNKKPFSCISCQQLHTNTTVMGIRHREINGAHENTPWAYLSTVGLHAVATQKNHEINLLKLQALNVGRKLLVWNQQIDGWKRLAIAIGKEDIPCIRVLMAVEMHNGYSVFSMIQKVDQAAHRIHSPKDYQEADFEHGYLILKLGGCAAAEIAS
ncbi:hypothetical protein E1B28_002934 [Marasmius oreades]|uniref:Uncharacterized protein n=1 Tax=Marasmius oreades TaxID=181124 RepID=A0A9P7RLD5_9AGAR|nr:uncharacterized protein E1B28_002934 [Marasmius oreades]KAG7085371.1 hypothetical protein E1B28_002934 [Marasmius oreades]